MMMGDRPKGTIAGDDYQKWLMPAASASLVTSAQISSTAIEWLAPNSFATAMGSIDPAPFRALRRFLISWINVSSLVISSPSARSPPAEKLRGLFASISCVYDGSWPAVLLGLARQSPPALPHSVVA